MSSVFVLFGVGIFLLAEYYKKNGINFNYDLCKIVGIGITWIISFGVYYCINLQYSVDVNHIQNYHSIHFLSTDLVQSWIVLEGIFSGIVGKTVIQIIFLIIGILTGIYFYSKEKKSLIYLFLGIILSCLLASFFNKYSLIIRLALFLFPILIILQARGLEEIWKRTNTKKVILIRVILFGLMIFTLVPHNSIKTLLEPIKIENPRQVLSELENENIQTLYISHHGVPAYEFYTKYYDKAFDLNVENVIYGKWKDNFELISTQLKLNNQNHFWIFDSHTFGQDKYI